MPTGGDAIVQALIDHGVSTIFGLPGVQNDGLYNALYDARDQITVIYPRHEQTAGYMALGAAMATGEVAVFNIVPGPGFLNASAALATAYGLNARVLCLVGQIPLKKIGKGTGQLHELPDQFAILQQFTKWSARIERPEEAPQLVAEAFRQLNSGRPRPVGLEVPMDVLKAAVSGQLPIAHGELSMVNGAVSTDSAPMEKAAQVLGASERPMIYVGSGAQGVSADVRQLAEMLQAPVVGYRTGKGVQDHRSPLSLFMPNSHELWKTTDAVLLVGTHARIPLGKWGRDDKMTLIKVDVDPAAHAIMGAPDIALTGSAETLLPALIEQVKPHNRERADRSAELNALRATWQQQTAFLEPQKTYLNIIRDALGEDGIFIDELTQVGYASRILYPAYHPRTYISTGHMGTLGYGFPTGLGVKYAMPDRRVVSITGDGGFMFGVQALATAVQHKIGLVTVLFNNNQYGNVQQMQRNLYGGRVIATDLVNPDFVALARSFNANAERTDADRLPDALTRAFASELPTLIEVPMGNVPSVDRFRSLGKVRG